MGSLLLFSDVDGTLLDHAGRYAMSPSELAPFLSHIDLILASSRTVLELSRNQRDLGIEGPVVAENGAVIALPWAMAPDGPGEREEWDGRPWRVLSLGWPAERLRSALQEAATETGVAYVEQRDVEPELGRSCSVLLRPADGADAGALAPLGDALRRRGCDVSSGGNWLAVTGGADKGTGARAMVAELARLGRRYSLVAAVGDGDNDVALLQSAARRFVVARVDGTWHPALRQVGDAECVPIPGIAGWREVLRALAERQEAEWS